MIKFLIVTLIILSGCAQSLPNQRNNLIDELSLNKFRKNIYSTKFFNIYSLEKIKDDKKLIIYIEGDGLSWIDRFTPSSNPTPINPFAFKMALIDEEANIIYLARIVKIHLTVGFQLLKSMKN